MTDDTINSIKIVCTLTSSTIKRPRCCSVIAWGCRNEACALTGRDGSAGGQPSLMQSGGVSHHSHGRENPHYFNASSKMLEACTHPTTKFFFSKAKNNLALRARPSPIFIYASQGERKLLAATLNFADREVNSELSRDTSQGTPGARHAIPAIQI